MKKKIGFLVLVAVVLVGGGLWGLSKKTSSTDKVTLYGNVDIRQVRLGFRVGGRIDTSLLDEGDTVTQGTVLAHLDKVPFEDALRSAQAQRDTAKAQLEKAINGPRPGEIEQAKAQVAERKADLTMATLTFDRYAKLVKTSAVSQSALDQALATRDAAQGRLKAAGDVLALLQEGSRVEDIDIARANLRAAEAALASAETSLADATLVAPSKGVIVSRVREPGAIVGAGEIVYVVALDDPVWVRAYISESLLGRVHPGLEVEVFSDTYPDRPYRGVVGFVSPVAEFTPKSVETPDLRTDLVYRLRIVIDAPDQALRQGMPMTVHIPTGSKGD